MSNEKARHHPNQDIFGPQNYRGNNGGQQYQTEWRHHQQRKFLDVIPPRINSVLRRFTINQVSEKIVGGCQRPVAVKPVVNRNVESKCNQKTQRHSGENSDSRSLDEYEPQSHTHQCESNWEAQVKRKTEHQTCSRCECKR